MTKKLLQVHTNSADNLPMAIIFYGTDYISDKVERIFPILKPLFVNLGFEKFFDGQEEI